MSDFHRNIRHLRPTRPNALPTPFWLGGFGRIGRPAGPLCSLTRDRLGGLGALGTIRFEITEQQSSAAIAHPRTSGTEKDP